MKISTTTTTRLLVIIAVLGPLSGLAQVQNSTLVAKFGIDGDLYSDYRQNGTFTAAGSHDWFKTANGAGIGVIDSSGAAVLKAQLASGKNISFTKGSNIPRFSVVDTFLHLDALYGRDYNGTDKTCFSAGSKNGDNPSIWGTVPTGGLVQDKSDIIDAFASMRRNGTTLNVTNPSHLILSMGNTILGTTGSRYVDFEMFVSNMNYDTITGIFSNAGSPLKGGHEDFQFNVDGSLKKIGDVDISISYSNTTVTDISIYIWVNLTTYQNTNGQQKFNFVPGEFYGAGASARWGYAKIVAKAGSVLPLWGSVNSATITGPAWGTASKDLGASNNNYYSLSNGLGQFSETAVDLTAIGIDAAFNNTGSNSCSPPYTKILIKTRSSATFTSALVDFSGPYTFLGIPSVSANILNPQTLTCLRNSVTLMPATIDNIRYYQWTTADGNIIGKSDTSVITIDKPGKYYLSAFASAGCPQNKDSVIVGSDTYKPVATAQSFGVINATFTNTAQLLGGDSIQSNYITPYGGSQGLLWNWSNSKGFLSSIQNPLTPDTGWHYLMVTEKRNSCKDTARAYVLWNVSVLATKFTDVKATGLDDNKVAVQWDVTGEKGNEKYELERSENGIDFTNVYNAAATGINNNTTYRFTDNINTVSAAIIYYRIKIQYSSGEHFYSSVVKTANSKSLNNNNVVRIFQHATGSIRVNYFTKNSMPVIIRITDINGRIIATASQKSVSGNNVYEFTNITTVKSQVLLVQVETAAAIFTKKIGML